MNREPTNRSRSRRPERGSALVVVLVLLVLITAFVVANSVTLRHLKEDLRRIEQKQEGRWKQTAAHVAVPPAEATAVSPRE